MLLFTISIFDSVEIAKAINTLDLPPAKLDIGKLTYEYFLEQKNYEDTLSFAKYKLSKANDAEDLIPKDIVLYGFGRIGRLLARELTNTLKALTPEKQKMFKRSLRVEHQVSEFSAQCTEGGWVFDLPSARKLQFDMECEMADIESRIVPKLRVRAKQ